MMRTLTPFIIGTCALLVFCPVALGSKRLKVDAEIDGKAAVLAVDTGSPLGLIMLKPSARRLDLDLDEENGREIARFDMRIGRSSGNVEALVIDSPPTDVDGLIGWPALQDKIWILQWDTGTVLSIPSVPSQVSRWMQLDLATNVPVAAFHPNMQGKGLVYIDTGFSRGVSLSDARWEAWRKNNPDAPMTVSAGWSPAAGGMTVVEQSWADHFTIGNLTIPHTTVQRSDFKQPLLEALIGVNALSRFDVVLDLKAKRVYLKLRTDDYSVPDYNRLGATFCPKSLDSKVLTAYVLTNSPAYRQGIRNGDVLLSVDDIDMTKWRDDPKIWKMEFWTAKPGTKYNLSLKRDGKRLDLQVTLEEILPVGDNKKKHNQALQRTR
ncbi:MAG: PDZ domain-containing protein [Planctomycetota bacterium]|jgi:hypothetical protein